MVYRKDDYKRICQNIDNVSKQVEKSKKNSIFSDPQKLKRSQKLQSQQEQLLKDYSSELQKMKAGSSMLMAFGMIMIMTTLNSYFSGVVVAKLPFVPAGFIQGLSHRNIPGTDFTECSMIFLYILCNMSIRPVLSKLLGTEGPKV